MSPDVRSKMVACIAVLLTTLMVTSCFGPVAMTILTIRVYNQSQQAGSLHWARPGLLGTPILGSSRTEAVQPCSDYSTAFDAGTLTLMIRSATSTMTLTVTSEVSAPIAQGFVIRPDGAIAQMYRMPGLQGDEPSPPPLCAPLGAPLATP